MIRTAGVEDPNFLLWQIAYAEFYVTKTLWPDSPRRSSPGYRLLRGTHPASWRGLKDLQGAPLCFVGAPLTARSCAHYRSRDPLRRLGDSRLDPPASSPARPRSWPAAEACRFEQPSAPGRSRSCSRSPTADGRPRRGGPEPTWGAVCGSPARRSPHFEAPSRPALDGDLGRSAPMAHLGLIGTSCRRGTYLILVAVVGPGSPTQAPTSPGASSVVPLFPNLSQKRPSRAASGVSC